MSPPLPMIDADTQPFWDAARRGELFIQTCADCGHRQFYPRLRCVRCGGATVWTPASGRGRIYSYTWVYRAAHESFVPLVPYVVALIDLDEGVRMMSRLRGSGVDDIRIGVPVKIAFEALGDDVTLPLFEVARP
jgi:uncharacterized OB-fold protein